jgi:hypothetical protein
VSAVVTGDHDDALVKIDQLLDLEAVAGPWCEPLEPAIP